MSYALGLDLGGSHLKAACVSESGSVLDFKSIAILPRGTEWQKQTLVFVDRIQTERQEAPWRIGVAAPGLVDHDGSSIAFMPERLQGLEGLNWSRFLKTSFPVPVLNDAHAALQGEVAFGAAAGKQDIVLLTLGTGVGGAIFSGGKLLRGHMGRAGHLGHVSLDPDGAGDIVKTPGSLEDAIGECSLLRRSKGAFATTLALLDAVQRGDEDARVIWMRSVKALAAAIAGFINVLDPEAVILGGGIALAGDALLAPLNEFLARFEWRPNGARTEILVAKLGERAGALGAAHVASLRLSDSLKHFFDY